MCFKVYGLFKFFCTNFFNIPLLINSKAWQVPIVSRIALHGKEWQMVKCSNLSHLNGVGIPCIVGELGSETGNPRPDS